MKTPASSKFLYVLGVIFLCVSAYMLYAAITYTQLYLATYEADFVDLWPNSVKYVIEHFVPYLAFGVICIGLGKAIATFAKAKTASEEDEEAKALGMKVRDEDMEELKSHELDVASELEKEYQKRLDESRMMLATEMATYDMRRDNTEKSILSRLEELEATLLAKASLPAVTATEEEPAELEEPGEEPVEVEEPEEESVEVEEPVEEPAEIEEPEDEPVEVEEPVEEPAEELEDELDEVEELAEEEAEEEPVEEPEEETEEPEEAEELVEEEADEESAEIEEPVEEMVEVEEPEEALVEAEEPEEDPIEEADEETEEPDEEPIEEEPAEEEAEEPTPILQPDESFASAFEKPTVYTAPQED